MSTTQVAADSDVKTILTSAANIEIAPSVGAAIAIGVGTALAVAGYKLLRPTLFVCGFLAGGLATSLVVEEMFESYSYVDIATWVGFALGGLLCGALALAVYTLGVFLIGAASGVILGFLLNSVFGHLIYPSHPGRILFAFLVVFGIIGGILTLKLERPTVIVATSFIGASVLVCGVGYFAGEYPSRSELKHYYYEAIDGEFDYHIPDAWWAYLVVTIIMFMLGMFIQFRKTGRKDKENRGRGKRNYTRASTPV